MGDFDALLGIDRLSYHYATLVCHEKAVQFFILGIPRFYFWGGRWNASNYLISFLKAGQMMRKRCHAFFYLYEGS